MALLVLLAAWGWPFKTVMTARKTYPSRNQPLVSSGSLHKPLGFPALSQTHGVLRPHDSSHTRHMFTPHGHSTMKLNTEIFVFERMFVGATEHVIHDPEYGPTTVLSKKVTMLQEADTRSASSTIQSRAYLFVLRWVFSFPRHVGAPPALRITPPPQGGTLHGCLGIYIVCLVDRLGSVVYERGA